MNQEIDHAFRVGERYENRKGVFEVLALDGTNMTIRWDTGEQAISPIELQAKILRNIERERAEAVPKSGYRPPRSYGELFTGLHPEDFSEDVTGHALEGPQAAWRSSDASTGRSRAIRFLVYLQAIGNSLGKRYTLPISPSIAPNEIFCLDRPPRNRFWPLHRALKQAQRQPR